MPRRTLLMLSIVLLCPALSQAQAPFNRPPVPGGGGNFGGFGAPFAPSTPTFSPYLNLLRNGGPNVQNYYGLVRPQQQFNQSLQGLEQQIGDVQQLTTGNNQAGGIVTGNRARFMNTGGYFMSNTAGGGGGGGGGAFVLTTPIQSPLSQSIQISNPNLRPNLNNGGMQGGGNPGGGRIR